jgi:hypothetical protein
MGYYYMTNTTLTSGVVNLQSPGSASPIAWTTISNPASTTYHYEGWLFVKDKITANNLGVIFYRGSNDTANQFIFGIYNNELRIYKQHRITNGANNSVNNSNLVATVTNDFPFQKWVYFVVNVINSKILEVYLNGKLVMTNEFTTSEEAFIDQTRSDIFIGGTDTVPGYITKFKRDPVALNPDAVLKNYLEGNGLNQFTNILAGYNASFSLYNTTGDIRKYTLL